MSAGQVLPRCWYKNSNSFSQTNSKLWVSEVQNLQARINKDQDYNASQDEIFGVLYVNIEYQKVIFLLLKPFEKNNHEGFFVCLFICFGTKSFSIQRGSELPSIKPSPICNKETSLQYQHFIFYKTLSCTKGRLILMCSLQTQTTIVIEYAPFSFVIERHRPGLRQCQKKINQYSLQFEQLKDCSVFWMESVLSDKTEMVYLEELP